MFVAKMDSLGNFLWAVSGTGGPYDDRALGMHVTPGGDVFLTGTFWGYIEFPSSSGPVSLSGNGCDTSVLIKIDSIYSADLSPGLIPGINPPCFFKLSAVSSGLKTIAV